MRKLILAGIAGLAFAAASALPAQASVGLFCHGTYIDIEIPLGGAAGLNPLSATIRAAGTIWTTEEGVAGATPIVPAQSASVDNRLYLDFSDPNLEGIIVEIRLFWAEEETDPVYGGTLRIAGHGAWAISCGMG